jgi:hypothetical protein
MSHALEPVRQRGNRTGRDIPGLKNASLLVDPEAADRHFMRGRFFRVRIVVTHTERAAGNPAQVARKTRRK